MNNSYVGKVKASEVKIKEHKYGDGHSVSSLSVGAVYLSVFLPILSLILSIINRFSESFAILLLNFSLNSSALIDNGFLSSVFSSKTDLICDVSTLLAITAIYRSNGSLKPKCFVTLRIFSSENLMLIWLNFLDKVSLPMFAVLYC